MEEDVDRLPPSCDGHGHLVPQQLARRTDDHLAHVGQTCVPTPLALVRVEQHVLVGVIEPQKRVHELADIHARAVILIDTAEHEPDSKGFRFVRSRAHATGHREGIVTVVEGVVLEAPSATP